MLDNISKARSAYGQSRTTVRSTRHVEYDAFATVTSRITLASEAGKTAFGKLAEALHLNRRLWSILAADVAESANGLPESLRAQIFYLAEFTDHHTTKVLKSNASVAPLVEINTMIMRGLQPQAEGLS